jgi:imidazole glycerol phosphate synthase subunit HisF
VVVYSGGNKELEIKIKVMLNLEKKVMKNVKFSIEEIVGDIITYDVVLEENGVKSIVYRDADDKREARQIISMLKQARLV